MEYRDRLKCTTVEFYNGCIVGQTGSADWTVTVTRVYPWVRALRLTRVEGRG